MDCIISEHYLELYKTNRDNISYFQLLFEKIIAQDFPEKAHLLHQWDTSYILITTKPIESSYLETEEEKHPINTINEAMIQENVTFEQLETIDKQLGRLRLKYPQNIIFYSFAISIKEMLNQSKEAFLMAKESYEKFQNSVHLWTIIIRHLLIIEDFEAINGLIKDQFKINEHFPDKDQFHFSEFAIFHSTMAQYYLKLKDLVNCHSHLHLLKNVSIEHGVSLETIDSVYYTTTLFESLKSLFVLEHLGIPENAINYLSEEEKELYFPESDIE